MAEPLLPASSTGAELEYDMSAVGLEYATMTVNSLGSKRTEHELDRRRSGQKSDCFGSRKDLFTWNCGPLGVKPFIPAAGARVYSLPVELTPSDRARWLAELSAALSDAQQLLFDLDFSVLVRSEGAELFQSIEAALIEVRSLQLSRSVCPRPEIDPQWTEIAPRGWDQG